MRIYKEIKKLQDLKEYIKPSNFADQLKISEDAVNLQISENFPIVYGERNTIIDYMGIKTKKLYCVCIPRKGRVVQIELTDEKSLNVVKENEKEIFEFINAFPVSKFI